MKDTIREGSFNYGGKMIPKKIHYIWFGRGEKNERVQHCIESWRRILPDYEIVEWNEDNFPFECEFFKEAYNRGKWAYAADVARMWILLNEGGIYMDTDVEVYKPLDEFLGKAFIGFEDERYLSTAVIGCEKGNPVIETILGLYKSINFKEYEIWTDYIKNEETSPCIVSNIFELMGLVRDGTEQEIKHFKIYPRSYFHTKDEGWTYHSYNGSW